MTSKHTPGPWVVHDHPTDPYQFGHYVTTADGLTVCSVAHQLPGRSPHGAEESTRAANARLIAAAPELLEACQTFAEWLRREAAGSEGQPWAGKRDTPEGEAAWREWWYENLRICDLAQEQVRAAIAKATGED